MPRNFSYVDDAKSNIILDIHTGWGEPEVSVIQIMAVVMDGQAIHRRLK